MYPDKLCLAMVDHGRKLPGGGDQTVIVDETETRFRQEGRDPKRLKGKRETRTQIDRSGHEKRTQAWLEDHSQAKPVPAKNYKGLRRLLYDLDGLSGTDDEATLAALLEEKKRREI